MMIISDLFLYMTSHIVQGEPDLDLGSCLFLPVLSFKWRSVDHTRSIHGKAMEQVPGGLYAGCREGCVLIEGWRHDLSLRIITALFQTSHHRRLKCRRYLDCKEGLHILCA
jgi:hypothetical protein